ncbi:MAG: hypothetical protein JWL77_5374 [Chthonomonadaceae bacterium]|nr:hypothetical protein [Chthonomonadaceae bacterium]
MIDYIPKYLTEKGFDLPQLLHDDFFLAIKLLFKNGLYVSSAKLLVSFIDSIAFVEYGDDGIPFVRWVDEYVDLGSVGITSEELWEHRNSLLHMTNLDSRKVLAGKVKRLLIYVGNLPSDIPSENNHAKYYSLQKLLAAIDNGINHWIASFNMDRNKIEVFVSRYDLIISDRRRLEINLD